MDPHVRRHGGARFARASKRRGEQRLHCSAEGRLHPCGGLSCEHVHATPTCGSPRGSRAHTGQCSSPSSDVEQGIDVQVTCSQERALGAGACEAPSSRSTTYTRTATDLRGPQRHVRAASHEVSALGTKTCEGSVARGERAGNKAEQAAALTCTWLTSRAVWAASRWRGCTRRGYYRCAHTARALVQYTRDQCVTSGKCADQSSASTSNRQRKSCESFTLGFGAGRQKLVLER